jgi:ribosomal-protein-alanine N-acetyltransferase
MALIVTSQEWVSLSVMTLFSPKGYAVLRAFTGSQALDRARGSEIDLLVIDRDLRDMTGVALTERLRADGLIADGTAVLMIAPSTWPRDEKLAALRAGAWEVCSLPFDGEEVVGYGIMSIAAAEAHILNLCVHPGSQRLGYGRCLLTALLLKAQQTQTSRVFLEVRPSNTAALGLYESSGFERIGVRPDYYQADFGREDAVVLASTLPQPE